MRLRTLSGFLLLFAALMLCARTAAAQGANDEALRAIVDGIYESEISKGKLKKALQNLESASAICEGNACSDEVQAELYIAIGATQARLGKKDLALASFVNALQLNPEVTLPKKYAKDIVNKVWEEAAGSKEASEYGNCRETFEEGDKPRGWRSAEAYYCYTEAKEAAESEDYDSCVEDARAALEIERQINIRKVLASCLEQDDRWGEAIEAYQALAAAAMRARQATASRNAAKRAASLKKRMPALVLQAPEGVEDLVVKLDGAEIPAEMLNIEIPADPGEHKVTASGESDGLPVGFKQAVQLRPGKTVTLLLTLTPGDPDPQTQQILRCLAEGNSPEDCLQKKTGPEPSNLQFIVSTEVSVYHDSMDVDVTAPAISANVEHVTDKWGVGAAFLVDVVTAASIDIVATASPHFRELRWVPAINGHVGFSDYDIAANANLSHEPDYIAATVGATFSAELMDKMVTPSFGYEYSHDINGKTDTPFATNSLLIDRHAINAGVGVVMDKATFGSVSATAVFEEGDTSKLYRHVPMFSPDIAPLIESGLTVEAVNFFREPERPLEKHPDKRKRFALAAAIAHRWTHSTLRVNERLYVDTWGLYATTTDARFLYDILKELRVWPHARFHAQTSAKFYELAYVLQRIDTDEDGLADATQLPGFRTGDRELGPLIGATGGAGIRYDFGSRRQMGVTLSGDVTYTRFLNHLFVKERIGLFGVLSFDGEFE